jgi:L-arabinose isomerase
MRDSKPKLGIVFFTARWFEEVVLGKDENSKQFNRSLKEDIGRIKEGLAGKVDLIDAGVVTSMEKARKAVNLFFSQDVDAVMLCFAVWSEDEYLLPFRRLMEIVPVIEWVNTPYEKPPSRSNIMELFRNSGIVGSFMSFGVNRMMGSSPRYVFGSTGDAGVDAGGPFEEIEKFARAASVRNKLKTVKLGVLPYRNDQMIVTYVDEFQLYSKIGPRVEYISVLQLKKAADSVPDGDIKDYVEKVKSNFSIDSRINDENLYSSARASLGMENIMNDMGIDGLALSDLNPELHEVMGLRPVLYPESLARSNKVVGNEGDLGGTTAMVILHALTGKPVMFTEIFNVDTKENIIATGHAGPSNYLMAESNKSVNITPDYELMDSTSDISGVWMEFIGKPGRVTIVNFISIAGDFQMTILGGESIGGNIRVEGYPHCAIKIDPAMKDFIESNSKHGTSHHWSVVHGDVKEELSMLADMLKIKKVVL